MISDVERIRVAVAWIVLRYKPSDTSYESYVLDLHAQFPLESNVIPTVAHWRKRSLRLEKELSELLDTYQVEHTELEIFREARQSKINPQKTAALPTTSAPSAKKKQKQKIIPQATSEPIRIPLPTTKMNLQAVLDNAEINHINCILTGWDTKRLLSSLQIIEDITQRATRSVCANEILVANTHRALTALSSMLGAVLSSPTNVASPISPRSILGALATLLPHLLTMILPRLILPSGFRTGSEKMSITSKSGSSGLSSSAPASQTQTPRLKRKRDVADMRTLDTILGQLTTEILVPLIRSFSTLSYAFLTSLFPTSELEPMTQRKAQAPRQADSSARTRKILSLHADDIRPDIYALLNDILVLIDAFCADTAQIQAQVPSAYTYVQSVKHYLALEAVRELTTLYLTPSSSGSSDSSQCLPGSSANAANNFRATQRIAKLAQKDSLWYLCNVLHLTFSTPAPCDLPPGSISDLADASHVAFLNFLRDVCRPTKPCVMPMSEVDDGRDPDNDGDVQTGAVGTEANGMKRPVRMIDEVGQGILLAVAEKIWLGI